MSDVQSLIQYGIRIAEALQEHCVFDPGLASRLARIVADAYIVGLRKSEGADEPA